MIDEQAMTVSDWSRGRWGADAVWGRTEPIKTIVLRSLVLLECENGFAYTTATGLKAAPPPASVFSENRIKANV
jgi:hypothetical protein